MKNYGYYDACDRAIKAMNRENLEAFGRLKMAKWDQVNIIKTVMTVYRESAMKARKRYFEVAFEAYVLGLIMCGVASGEAHRKAEKEITFEWLDENLEQTDVVTLYRFDTETERKAYRLAETLEVSQDKDFEINKALRFWSQQLGQYAISITDQAVVQAFIDYGLELIEWETANDERVCHECYALDKQVFRVTEIPPKPHWGCRCRFRPVFRSEGD